jgi:futalosine hydrolase
MIKETSSLRLLIVSATSIEIKPLLEELGEGQEMQYRVTRYLFGRFQVDVLITGVGMVPTAVYTSMVLGLYEYDAVINAGICGSFNRSITLGTVLNIVTDCLPETGAEDGEHFLSLIDLNLLDQDEFPFNGGKLVNDSLFESELIGSLPRSNGVTVNTVHGNALNIEAFLKRNQADVESMEGAAFMFSCKLHKIRHIQVRSVSNYIEDRNLSNWQIPLAIKNLNLFLVGLLNE